MDTRSIAAMLLKLTGLVLVVACVVQLPAYFPLTTRGFDFSIGEIVGAAALAIGPMAVLGLFFWFFPGTVVNKVIASDGAEPPVADMRPLELVALTILGVYLFTDGLIGVVRDVVLLIAMHRQDPGLSLIPASLVGHIAAIAAELVIGAGLCLGARGVSRVIEKLRR